MSRMTMPAFLIGGAVMLSPCAVSIHQLKRAPELLGILSGFVPDVHATVRFADLKYSPSLSI